jgi:AraC-like DNA-binding protein
VFSTSSGDNFETAIDVFSASYNLPALALTPSKKKFEWRHTVAGDSTMTFRTSRLMARGEMLVDSGDEFVVVWAKVGQATFASGHSSTALLPHSPLVLPSGPSIMSLTCIDVDHSLIHIKKDFLSGVAEELDGAQFDTFVVLSSVSRRALLGWYASVNLAANVLLDASAPASGLLSREMSRLIAISMLTTFPYTSTEPVSADAGFEPTGVRLACEFMQDNAHLPIGPVEIAGAAGLSVRTLQHAFRRYRETTPSALLHSIRLDRVHAELLAADSHSDSVAAVARSWGFAHLGRFSASYQLRFGQLPSQTLRRK